MWKDELAIRLNQEEGRKNKLYQDTVGKWTIGVGRNLSDRTISEAVIDLMLEEDIQMAITDIKKLIPNFDQLSDNRKIVVTDMMFNMGYTTLSQFKNTLNLINHGHYEQAATAMLQSRWAQQVGQRAIKLAELMKNG